nr:ABC transporter permease [Pseudonocardia acaciae]
MSPRITAATARRVLAQLHADRRTVAMLLVVPSVLLILINRMFDSKPDFDKVGLLLLGIFPFTVMFLITSVAMLRERTSGTLERLLTTPMSKLDLLLGYGIAFAVAATAQAVVTCTTAYVLLDLYTPGSPLLVVVIAVASAVLGMAIGLLCSAFATSEFQAVQFMPAVVMPQVLLGGLFVPREQMADWLERISDGLPLTYAIEALHEVGKTSLVTDELLGDLAVVVGAAMFALTLAASTLRRRTGALSPRARLALRAVPATLLVAAVTVAVVLIVDAARFVTTDNAQVDGDKISVTAPVEGTLVGWHAELGTVLRKDQIIGRIQMTGGFAQLQRVIRAPADGTVARAGVVEGTHVTAGTELAVAYDLSKVDVTARIDETDIGAVRLGQEVDIEVDSYPGVTFTGFVREIQSGTDSEFATTPQRNTTGSFQKRTQVIPVKIAIADAKNLPLVPGMNVTVKVHKD